MKREMSVMVGSGRAEYLRDIFPEGTVITAGDTKIMWDSDSEDEVDAAKSTFDKLLKKGYIAFRAEGKDGHQGEKINKWDPSAERLIMVPKIQGGAA